MYKGMEIIVRNILIQRTPSGKRALYSIEGHTYMVAEYRGKCSDAEIKRDVLFTLNQRYGK